MARRVQVASGLSNVQLPNGFAYDGDDIVTLTDAQYQMIPSANLDGNPLVDLGPIGEPGDATVVQAANVAAPAALTSAAASGGEPPTEAEFNALRTDVANLRTTVASILTSLKGAGKPMVPDA
jgi:hypothetical protein